MGKSGKAARRKLWSWGKAKEKEETQAEDLLHKTENGNATSVTEEPVPGEFVPRDGGWGWVVCLTSLWANGTVFGIINTFGIIYVQMRDYYSKDDPEVSLKTAFVGSTCTGVTFLMCTVSSIMSDRIGIRPTAVTGAVLATAGLVATAFIQRLELLYLTFGIMLGIGSSMVYSPSLVILGHYFKKHMGLVNGIVAFGSSIFTIGLTRILPYLLNTIDIKYCFLFLAGLQCMLIILTMTWKPVFKKEDHLAALTLSTESVYQHCNDCCSWTRRFLNVKIWKQKAYVIWVVSLGIALFGYFVPFFHLPKHIADNFPGEDGSLPILCLSITSGVSRIICGKVADLPWVSRLKMQQLAFVILGVATLCIPFPKSFGGIIPICLLMGICDGVFVCLLGPIAFDIVGPSEASQAIGFLLGIFSIPFTLGPPIAGWMYDSMGDYRVAFHVAGIPPILGAIVMFFIPKVEQSYPAVTETQEFASISMLDVYNEVRVPKPHQAHHGKSKLTAPSGPATELEFIHSNEILHLGSSSFGNQPMSTGNQQPTDKSVTDTQESTEADNQDSEDTPMLKTNNNDTKDDQNEQRSSSHNESKSNIKNEEGGNDQIEQAENSNYNNINQDQNEADSKYHDKKVIDDNQEEGNSNNEQSSVGSVHTEDIDNEVEPIDTVDVVEPTNIEDPPYNIESTSLLEEVGKYFEANRISFEDGKTSV